LAVLFTGSRAGLVAFLAGIITVIGMRFGRKAVAILLTCCVMVLVLMPNPFRDRIYAEHVSNPEAYARWNIWHSSIYAILDHPFGAGPGLYQYIYPRYAIPLEGTLSRYGRIAQTAHNEYLQIGVELGLAGLIVFLWGMVVLFRELRDVMNQRLARWQRGVVVGATGAITSVMIHALFDSNLHEPGIVIVLVLCVGIVLAARQLVTSCHDAVRRISLESKTVRLAWAPGGTLLALILLAAILRPALAWTEYEDGSYAAKQQDHQTAIARYQAAIELEPGKALYHSSLAASYFTMFERTGDLALSDATLRELQVARHLNPLDGRLWGLEGYVYRSLSDHQHVVHAREPASAKQLMDWRALARFAYENAVVLEPFNPMHYLELGRLHLKEGHPERAMATLRQATAVEPNFLPAREWLVRMYLELGETDRAQAEYREILDRRDRFKHTMKNAFEAQFLSVDVNSLEAAIASSKGRT
jgi:O-antigen ligase